MSRVKHPVFLGNLLSSSYDPCITEHLLPLLVTQAGSLGIVPEESSLPNLSNKSPSPDYPNTYGRTTPCHVFRSELAGGMF